MELFIKTLKSLLKPGHEILVLIYISYAIDSLVHTIFALKYWVLSRKFEQITNKTKINIELRANLLFAFQIITITSSVSLQVYSTWTGNIDNTKYLAYYCALPPVFVVLLIVDALY